MKNVERQGFLPTSYYDEFTSDEESSSEESESDSDDESPYTKFQQYGGANQSSRSNRFSCIISKHLKDPFVEVKDEDIESVETDFNDDGTRIIHLKNGLILWGKFKRKRRYGLGSLSGAPLEAKGKSCSLSFNNTLAF